MKYLFFYVTYTLKEIFPKGGLLITVQTKILNTGLQKLSSVSVAIKRCSGVKPKHLNLNNTQGNDFRNLNFK